MAILLFRSKKNESAERESVRTDTAKQTSIARKAVVTSEEKTAKTNAESLHENKSENSAAVCGATCHSAGACSNKDSVGTSSDVSQDAPRDASDSPTVRFRPREGRIYAIATEKIEPNPSQPRRNFDDETIFSLAESIEQHGILQPLAVRYIEGADGRDRYELIAGERRLRAAQLLRLEYVPCIIIDADKKRSAELAIVENLQREDLNIFEEAVAISSLIDIYSMTQEQIARRLSVSQSYIANKLRLLKLTDVDRSLILKGHLTERHARAALRISDAETRTETIKHFIEKGMNVASAESYVESLLRCNGKKHASKSAKYTGAIKDIRIFYNTLDRAIDIMRRSGINAVREKRELDDEIELTIRIPKSAIPKEASPAGII